MTPDSHRKLGGRCETSPHPQKNVLTLLVEYSMNSGPYCELEAMQEKTHTSQEFFVNMPQISFLIVCSKQNQWRIRVNQNVV